MSWLLRDGDVLAAIETWRSGKPISGAAVVEGPRLIHGRGGLDVAWCVAVPGEARCLEVRRITTVGARRVARPRLGAAVVAEAGAPIGNLADLSARAIEALAGADVIFCEDTRRTRQLLAAIGVRGPRLRRLDRHTEEAAVSPALTLVMSGAKAVLVSDAGMPSVSDPGSLLVKGMAEAGVPVTVIPGPCAVSAALAVSGFPAGRYTFAGFLPRKGADRRAALAAVAGDRATVVLYEAPHRVAATLADLAAACGPERPVAAARELTKLHEEIWRGDLGGAAAWSAAIEPRGEWVIVLGPVPAVPVEVTDGAIASALTAARQAGLDRREAVANVAASLSVPRRRVYEMSLGGPK
jgi:16S rRNA (cytidine1402-2'-O)-methyltransferase